MWAHLWRHLSKFLQKNFPIHFGHHTDSPSVVYVFPLFITMKLRRLTPTQFRGFKKKEDIYYYHTLLIPRHIIISQDTQHRCGDLYPSSWLKIYIQLRLLPVYFRILPYHVIVLKRKFLELGNISGELNFDFRSQALSWSYPQLLENFFGPPPSSQPWDRLWLLSLDFHSMPPLSFLVSFMVYSFNRILKFQKWIKT